MRFPRSRCSDLVAGGVAAAIVAAVPAGTAQAQACCAGATATTPGRLGLRDDALVGFLSRGNAIFGSFDESGRFAPSAPHAVEVDLEQDLFVSLRVLGRGQLSILTPFLETRRLSRRIAEFGGGVGDLNVSGRYDFLLDGQSRYFPGVALLAGVTFPTGVAPDNAFKPLATDSTGTGVVQGNVGLALEQSAGDWLFDVSGLLAIRAPRSIHGVEENGVLQWTALGSVSWTVNPKWTAALSLSYVAEGDAVIDGRPIAQTGRRTPNISLSAGHALTKEWRLQSGVFFNPPIPFLGQNQPASAGLSWTLLYGWPCNPDAHSFGGMLAGGKLRPGC